MSSLYIYTPYPELKALLVEQLQKHRYTDSGFDIPMLKDEIYNKNDQVPFRLGVHVSAGDYKGNPQPCLLMPRSSIYKTPYRLCNSIGLLDAGYRGEVKAMTDVVKTEETFTNLETGTRLFQLCSHDFMPWKEIIIVDSMFNLLPAPDNRGDGGFGSTGGN